MKASEIIQSAHLSRSVCRERIINVLLESKSALSEQEIKAALKDQFDRTSVYRTFKTLIENGILHQIPIEKGLVKYAVNNEHKDLQHHAHFYCQDCGKVVCMDQPIPTTLLNLNGFSISTAELILKGTCPDCNAHIV